MENTGKYDLQPSTFRLVISIIEVICLIISFLLVHHYLSLRYKSHSLNIHFKFRVNFRRKKEPSTHQLGLCIVTDKVG